MKFDEAQIVGHLQLISTWAKEGQKTIAGIEPQYCKDVEEWVNDALELLKKKEEKIEELIGMVIQYRRYY